MPPGSPQSHVDGPGLAGPVLGALLTGFWYFGAICVRSRSVMPTVNSSLFEALLVHVWSNITHATAKAEPYSSDPGPR